MVNPNRKVNMEAIKIRSGLTESLRRGININLKTKLMKFKEVNKLFNNEEHKGKQSLVRLILKGYCNFYYLVPAIIIIA